MVVETITVRYVTGSTPTILVVEHNGQQKAIENFPADDENDPTRVIKGLEIVLGTLGFVLDEDQLYMDDSSIVATFRAD